MKDEWRYKSKDQKISRWYETPIAWQTVAAKKGKKIAETSAEKSSNKANLSKEGKIFPTGNVTISQPASTEAKTPQSQSPNGPKKVPRKTFATTVVKDWYNTALKKEDEDSYNKINSCFRALQSNDLKASNFLLIQVKQILLREKAELKETKAKHAKAEELLKWLCQYFITTRSEALHRREQELLTGKSEDEKQLKQIFSHLKTTDMVSLRISDFLEILRLYKILNERVN